MPKKLLLFLVKVAVTSFLLYFVFRDLSFDGTGGATAGLLVAAPAARPRPDRGQGILVVAWRWAQILTSIDRPIAGQDLVAPTIIGLFFNQVLPSTVGGDGIRVWLLSRMERSLGLALRSVLIDRLLGMLALMVMSGLGALAVMPVAKSDDAALGRRGGFSRRRHRHPGRAAFPEAGAFRALRRDPAPDENGGQR